MLGSGKGSSVGNDRSSVSAALEEPTLGRMRELHRILARCAVRVLARKGVSDG